MNGPVSIEVLRQHLIDPEICIRCNTCEETCPVDAITHDENNYVVKADICNGCMACVPPCPTGAIDNWRSVLKADAYSIDEQYTWDVLPEGLKTGSKADDIARELRFVLGELRHERQRIAEPAHARHAAQAGAGL